MITRVVLLSVLVLLGGLSVGGVSAHHIPSVGDRFAYSETSVVSNGVGADYQGYTQSTVINGSLAVTGVLPNGTESALYYNVDHYSDNTGAQYSWTSPLPGQSGAFTFSAETFQYVQGTDNQTGDANSEVWFLVNNSLPVGASFSILGDPMTVVSTSYDFALQTAAGAYVQSIFTEGTGNFTWGDGYNLFDATYDWKAYFDPATGYILGYLYTEHDITTNNTSGDGFTYTDTLAVTYTSYPLTPGVAPSSSSSSGGQSSDWILIGLVLAVIVVVVAVVVALAVSRSRRRGAIPKHSATGQVSYAAPPLGPPPPAINLTPSGQPAVQQIIIRETVKVNCRFCGSLIDSTAEKCPFCGATRS
jgi:hypothetical protein